MLAVTLCKGTGCCSSACNRGEHSGQPEGYCEESEVHVERATCILANFEWILAGTAYIAMRLCSQITVLTIQWGKKLLQGNGKL